MLHRLIKDTVAHCCECGHRELRLNRRYRFVQEGLKRFNLRDGVVRNADRSYEPTVAQRMQRFGHIGRMRKKVRSMDHEEINVVDP